MFWEYAVGGLRAHRYWAGQIGRLIFEYRLDNDPPLAARAYALQNIAGIDTGIACWDSKYTYWAIRPFQLDPEVKPVVTTPNHPSYPAAHGCLSTAEAVILGYLFPRDAAVLDALAAEAAESRVWAGIHYRSDIVAGRALGRAVAEKVIARSPAPGWTGHNKAVDMTGLDGLGFLAAGLVLATFCMKRLVPLRITAIASNIAFILYGYAARIEPVLVLHLILLPVNFLRLAEALPLTGRCAAIRRRRSAH